VRWCFVRHSGSQMPALIAYGVVFRHKLEGSLLSTLCLCTAVDGASFTARPYAPTSCILQKFRPSITFNLTATDLLSSLLPLAVAVGGNLWIGGYRDASNPPWGLWSWSDGTNASNLNCGPPSGCGPWTPGQPKCVSTSLRFRV
jgi:hypothetical protein